MKARKRFSVLFFFNGVTMRNCGQQQARTTQRQQRKPKLMRSEGKEWRAESVAFKKRSWTEMIQEKYHEAARSSEVVLPSVVCI